MEWQDISTAPKNAAGKFFGPTILIYCTADGLPWPAYWGPGGPDNEGAWHVPDADPPKDEVWPSDASHWMPLPEPPAGAS